MKKIYTFACGAMLLAGLASCEMKEELFNNGGFSGDTGLLDLGVAFNSETNTVPTKADEIDESTLPEGDGFTIELSGAYDTSFVYKTEMEPVLLPVGDYTVYAHSTIEGGLVKYMDVPYYGKKQTATISKDRETGVNIVCGMENTKFQLVYGSEFATMYGKWEITVTAGDCVREYTYDSATDGETPQSPAAEYWALAEDVKTFTVQITAWTKEGDVKVTQSKSFSKDDATNYQGGDAIRITMESGDPSASVEGQATISIDVQVFSQYQDITEEVPVTGEDDDPGTGGGGEETGDVTITLPKTTYTLPADTSLAKSANAVISAPAGLKSVKVTINPDSEGFEQALGLVGDMLPFMTEGVELVVENAKDPMKAQLEGVFGLIAPGTTVPTKDPETTNYNFPVGNFFSVLAATSMGTTTSTGHVFKISVEDNNGNKDSAELNIVVTETVDTEL